MARRPRVFAPGRLYHVIVRGNQQRQTFRAEADYKAYLEHLEKYCAKFSISIYAYCLMPNHFHLVVEPAHQTALSQFMQWLLTSHVRRYHKHYGSSGHVWQGRFKSFAVQRDEHLITALRYVLQNPVRAGLSETVHEWPWSSARRRQLVDRSPVDEEIRWSEQLESRLDGRQVATIRECLKRAPKQPLKRYSLGKTCGGMLRPVPAISSPCFCQRGPFLPQFSQQRHLP